MNDHTQADPTPDSIPTDSAPDPDDIAHTCAFCPATVPSVEAAIEAGWIPSFWLPGDDGETSLPVCPACQVVHLEDWEGGNGDPVVKPGHVNLIRPEALGIPGEVIAMRSGKGYESNEKTI